MSTGYTYSCIGQRAVVPREDTRNRRVDVLGAQIVGTRRTFSCRPPAGRTTPGCCWSSSADLAGLPGGAAALGLAADGLDGQLPVWARPRPCTVVLDNASAHTAKAFKGRREQLTKIGVGLFYLPPRSPELKDIELVWRQAKYQDYPQRAQTSTNASGKAVDQAMNHQRDRIRQSATNRVQAA
ncbi:transposase [Streptomyces varsoviensis]|uniref:transposase n=1 Tax=Streptomyces varsoviensis TaxID=67373 RepID=UPI000B26D78F|nr:transposase [Streptomyces varsoviensis]